MTLITTPVNDLVAALRRADQLRAAASVSSPPDLPGLMRWVPQCEPDWREPHHLTELVEVLDRAPRGGLRITVACPIRHYKTSTVLSAIALWLRRDPRLRIIYMTYSIGRTVEIGKEIRDLCKRMGVKVDKNYDTIALWRTEAGGGVDVMSAQQSRLGADVDVLVVDDPYESDAECERVEVRDAVDKTIEHYTMRLSRGGSCVLVMSRFHTDDAIGRRMARTAEKWTHVHKRAVEIVGGEEVALAPSVRTVEEMGAIRAALRETDPFERLWWSQWQNEPRPVGHGLFREPLRYTVLPAWPGFRDVVGVDMAYSTSRAADWFAIVLARMFGGQMFLRRVERFRADEGLAETRLRAALLDAPGASIYSYMSGPEIGVAHNLAAKGLCVNVLPARYGKLIRARKTMDRLNGGNGYEGRVLVPDGAEWAAGFVRRLLAWRALDGDEDDEIDALVSAHDGAYAAGVATPITLLGRPRL